MHWRDAHRSYQTPLSVRRLGSVSITTIWLGLARVVLCTDPGCRAVGMKKD